LALRLFVDGGYDGLRNIYYNYFNKQGVKYIDINPFENFIKTNEIEQFYFDVSDV
jgi:hypothetical protein